MADPTRVITNEDEPDGDWIECYDCDGSGEGEHDCGEDTCVCLHPEPDACRTCLGEGGWWIKGDGGVHGQ